MIRIINASKTFSKNQITAANNINLTVNDGEIFGFLGANGAGKTTTIKMLTGILTPTSGELYLDNINLLQNPLQAKKTFTFVPDNPEVHSRLKVIEYFNFICDIYKIPKQQYTQDLEEYCSKFGISEYLKTSISALSHGTKQKLFLIASLLPNPKNWILDEPIVGLDPQAAFLVKQLMKEKTQQGGCVFFSTHVMEVAEKICDKIGIINQGKLIYTGTIENLKQTPEYASLSLEQIFLKLTGKTVFMEN